MALNELSKLRRKVNQVNLSEALDQAIVQTSDILLDLIRSQLQKGRDSKGLLPKYKSDKYASEKQDLGSQAPFGITDLIKTGNFVNKLKIIYGKSSLRIRSTDSKNSIIFNKYGTNIAELNEENFTYYTEEILLPLIIKYIEDGLFK